MKWYLNVKGEAIIGAYSDKLLDDLIEYEADTNFDRTNYKFVDGNVVLASEEEKRTLYKLDKSPTPQDAINAMLMKEIAQLKVGVLNE